MIKDSNILNAGWMPKSHLSILVFGALYYMAILVLAVTNVESKFIMDGYSHVFTIANWETFSPTMGRHVLLLLQIFPVFCAKLGATTKEIMVAYVVWDVFFFVVIFLILLYILKDSLAALLSVSVHVFGMVYNHFMMVGELSHGSMFAIMTISLIVNWNEHSFTKRSLIIPAAFFTVSSHPLALISFLVSIWIWRFYVPKETSFGHLKLLFVSLSMVLLKWFFLDDYDKTTINQAQSPLSESVLHFFDPRFFLNFSLQFISSSPIVAALTIFCFVFLINESKYRIACLFLLFQVGWMMVAKQYLDFSHFSLEKSQSMMHDRYLFPMRFLTLFTLCFLLIPFGEKKYAWSHTHRYVVSSWVLGIPFLIFSAQKPGRTVASLRNSINYARSLGVTKSYYPVEEYCQDTYIHRGSFFATFVLSSIDEGETCHVIHASEKTITTLQNIHEDELLLMDDLTFSYSVLNPTRFTIEPSAYKKVDFTCNIQRPS